jgi:hypothetical protein
MVPLLFLDSVALPAPEVTLFFGFKPTSFLSGGVFAIAPLVAPSVSFFPKGFFAVGLLVASSGGFGFAAAPTAVGTRALGAVICRQTRYSQLTRP